MKSGLAYSLICLLLLGSSTATATLLDFNYNNLGVMGSSTSNSVSMEIDGIAVDITAWTVSNDGDGNISGVTQLSGEGIGVYTNGSTSGNLGVVSAKDDGSLLDAGNSSTDMDEGLLFTFNKIVRLEYIDFDYFTSNGGDDFNLTVDNNTVLKNIDPYNGSSSVNNVGNKFDEYEFNDIIGTSFLFWADDDKDAFRIDKIRVSIVNSVPEPSTIMLFGFGLLGLCLRRVKNRI